MSNTGFSATGAYISANCDWRGCLLELNTYETLVAASLVLLAGRKLVAMTAPLRTFNIPEPVAGGLVVALCLALARYVADVQGKFDTSTQASLMLAFFASLGLSANLASLKQGGKSIRIYLVVVAGLPVLQNGIGVGLASAIGRNPATGLLAGSISLSGGHGTSAAWGKTFMEQFDMSFATELGVACATFWLVLGGLTGGPVARYLLRSVPRPVADPEADAHPLNFENPQAVRLITASALIETLALILVCLTAGHALADMFEHDFELPTFVWVLFVGVLLRNGLVHGVRSCAVHAGQRQPVDVPGNGADEPASLGACGAGLADDADPGRADRRTQCS